ncbi:MAG TPA: formate--tetrahydrofolate ligase [Candidatus Thermoplasmatota archaeon]|nr:formate--tetrahydrofolate ligase [Candidatus Thermoplasmatota archaeon]
MRPLREVVAELGIPETDLEPYGHHKAKLSLDLVARLRRAPRGKLVLVTGMTPTKHGEGKTTTTIGLAQALCQRGSRAIATLREPSLGPVFGLKGGATGGGASEVLPRTDINLHFTGDFHAVGAAANLLATLVDAHLHHGNALSIDATRVVWKRALDTNDRALRHVVTGLGGSAHGPPRETGFVITAASEVMAILCLASGLDDLKRRLGEIVVAYRADDTPVLARDLRAQGAMAALLVDALRPNLVQTTEGTPAVLHGGPFGNIAHGTNSLLADWAALGLADYAVTEAGFGSDLGAEKFFHIACRAGGLWPSAVVIVATCRALKMHGGLEADGEDVAAVERGLLNLEHHVDVVRAFGFAPIVAVNRFATDTDAEVKAVLAACVRWGVAACEARPFQDGGKGCLALADLVEEAPAPPAPRFLYELSDDVRSKIETIATRVYGAAGVEYDYQALQSLRRIERMGLSGLPVCMAKTAMSVTDDPKRLGAPRGWMLTVRDVVPSAGAGFLVALAGDVMLMPGLGKSPAAQEIDVDANGRIVGI